MTNPAKVERFGVSMPANILAAIDGHVETTNDNNRSAYLQRLAEDDLRHVGKHPDGRVGDLQVEVAKLVAVIGETRVIELLQAHGDEAYAAAGRAQG